MTSKRVGQVPQYEQVAHDLAEISHGLQAHPALARALSDAAAPRDSKMGLIDEVFAHAHPDARSTLIEGATQSWDSTNAMIRWIDIQAVKTDWQWAQAESILESAIDEVFAFGRLVATDHSLRAAVTNRAVALRYRQDLVNAVIGTTVSSPALDLCRMAVGFRRGTIDHAIRSFVLLGVELTGAQLAQVTVAKPLTPEQKEAMAKGLARRLGTSIIIEEVVDPEVLGGVRVECGAEVIDDTVASRLRSARRDFASGGKRR